ncbi:MAG TPA: sugar phosphate isomerase/epimerase [Methanocorpusculum sp.]|nr:sugar phosphate isomerase/epimerase [Methanocorpusculum sp.]
MVSKKVSLSSFCLISRPLADALDTLTEHTQAVELFNDGRHYTNDVDLLRSYPFDYTVHAPSRSVNIASVLEPIRKASVELVCESLTLAAEIKATGVVFHPGYYTFEEEYENAVSALQRSLAEIRQFARDVNVSCCVENMGNWGYFFLQKPADIPLIGSTDFCLDIGHANECGTLNEYLSVPFTQIHVHDNDGTSDAHLALGKGTIDIPSVIAAIQRNGDVSLISECAELEDAVATKKILEKWLKI